MRLFRIDQFFLYMHKVRLGSFDQELGDKFNISQSTVGRTVTTWAIF